MKNIITMLSLLFTLNSFSQTYYSFPDSAGIWRQMSSYGNMGQPTGFTHYSFFIDGDTTINTNTYRKLYLSYSLTDIDTTAAKYFAALREDQKKVYVYLDSNVRNNQQQLPSPIHFYESICSSLTSNILNFNRDLLLYDFDVSVGDTVTYPYLDSLQIIIQNIDSVQIQNQHRKRYSYWRPWPSSSSCYGILDYQYTEGIGETSAGLFSLWWNGPLDNEETFHCFKDGEIIYSKVADCENPSMTTAEIQTTINIKVFPNPTSEKLRIETSGIYNNEEITASLFDISGKLVLTSKIDHTKHVDVSNIKKGLYLLKLNFNDQFRSRLITIQ